MNIYDEKSDFVKKVFSKKRVVIVGPAGYLDDNVFGNHIDSYDVVVRFLESLDSLKHIKKQVGARTDVIITSLSSVFPVVPQVNWKDPGRVLLCPFFLGGYYALLDRGVRLLKAHSLANKLDINLCVRTKESFIAFWKQVQSGPTTGVAAIDYILQFDIQELHITGFTFNHLKSTYMKSYKVYKLKNVYPDNGRWHYPLADEVFCNKTIRSNKVITVDNHIKNKVLLSDKALAQSITELKNNPKGHRYRGKL